MKRSEKTIGPYLILFTIVLSWNGIWWGLVTPEGYPEVASRSSFRVQYFPSSSDQGDVGIDPAIFSLPSRVGFSQAALLSRDSVLPPLEFEKSLSIFMPPPPQSQGTGQKLDVEPMDRQLIQLIKRGPIAGGIETDESWVQSPPKDNVVLDLVGMDLEESDIADWTAVLASLTNVPWSIKFSFDTDSVGFVEHVFVEQSTGDLSLDRNVRASMSRLQFAAEEKAGLGSLWIKHIVREDTAP